MSFRHPNTFSVFLKKAFLHAINLFLLALTLYLLFGMLFSPNFSDDGYPRSWVKTLNELAGLSLSDWAYWIQAAMNSTVLNVLYCVAIAFLVIKEFVIKDLKRKLKFNGVSLFAGFGLVCIYAFSIALMFGGA